MTSIQWQSLKKIRLYVLLSSQRPAVCVFSSESLCFLKPYSKQDLQIIFSECSENCEDQSCVAKCQRDFYINIDCKPEVLKILQVFILVFIK